jgi:hypothetical protein
MKQWVTLSFILCMVLGYSQVGIGTTNPSAASMLEVSSSSNGGATYKGLMPPRVPNVAARDAINAGYSDFGLLIFVEDTGSLEIWDGDSWNIITSIAIARPEVWINEIHYDNVGTDTGEAIEVAGEAGTDLSDYEIVLYNGANGQIYNTTPLTGIIANQSNGYGFVVINYTVNGIQNGSPDGIALVKSSTNQVIQFLSYEGTFTAIEGSATGQTSVDIGVSESDTTPVGASLQLTGIGSEYVDFTWASSATATFGNANNGQTFN